MPISTSFFFHFSVLNKYRTVWHKFDVCRSTICFHFYAVQSTGLCSSSFVVAPKYKDSIVFHFRVDLAHSKMLSNLVIGSEKVVLFVGKSENRWKHIQKLWAKPNLKITRFRWQFIWTVRKRSSANHCTLVSGHILSESNGYSSNWIKF